MQRINVVSDYVWSTVCVIAVSLAMWGLFTVTPGLHNPVLFTALSISAAVWAADTGFSTRTKLGNTERMCLLGAAYGFVAASVVVWA